MTDVWEHGTSSKELGWSNYQGLELRSIRELREIFPTGQADKLNWLFLGQKSFHGDDTTLDEVEAILLGEGKASPINSKWPISVLVVHPRLTTLKWGYIDIEIKDVEYLRGLVRSTIEVIQQCQEGCT